MAIKLNADTIRPKDSAYKRFHLVLYHEFVYDWLDGKSLFKPLPSSGCQNVLNFSGSLIRLATVLATIHLTRDCYARVTNKLLIAFAKP